MLQLFQNTFGVSALYLSISKAKNFHVYHFIVTFVIQQSVFLQNVLK